MFKLEPCVVFTKIVTLARGQDPGIWQQGIGAGMRIGPVERLHHVPSNPWLGLVDLAGTPLPDRFVTLLVNWFRNLRPELAKEGLYLSRPRVSGYRLTIDFESFENSIPLKWPQSFTTNPSSYGYGYGVGTPVSFLVPNWRSLGGESQIRFRDVKLLDRIRLNHRDQSYRILARSFSGEEALLLARLSQEEDYVEIVKGFNCDQKAFFPELLKRAKSQFLLNNLLGGYNLEDFFPGIAYLLRQQEDHDHRLKLCAEWLATAFDIAPARPLYARAGENSWQGANYLPSHERAVVIPEDFAQNTSEIDPYIEEEELEHLFRTQERYKLRR